jgi:hypothetical protein
MFETEIFDLVWCRKNLEFENPRLLQLVGNHWLSEVYRQYIFFLIQIMFFVEGDSVLLKFSF